MGQMTNKDLQRSIRNLGWEGKISLPRAELIALHQQLLDARAGQPQRDKRSPLVKHDNYEPLGLDRTLEFQVEGEPGWFHFNWHTINEDTGQEWLDAFGGTKHYQQHRSFHIHKVRVRRGKTVTRKRQPRTDESSSGLYRPPAEEPETLYQNIINDKLGFDPREGE